MIDSFQFHWANLTRRFQFRSRFKLSKSWNGKVFWINETFHGSHLILEFDKICTHLVNPCRQPRGFWVSCPYMTMDDFLRHGFTRWELTSWSIYSLVEGIFSVKFTRLCLKTNSSWFTDLLYRPLAQNLITISAWRLFNIKISSCTVTEGLLTFILS